MSWSMFRVLPGVNVRIEWEGEAPLAAAAAACLQATATSTAVTLRVEGIRDCTPLGGSSTTLLLLLLLCSPAAMKDSSLGYIYMSLFSVQGFRMVMAWRG